MNNHSYAYEHLFILVVRDNYFCSPLEGALGGEDHVCLFDIGQTSIHGDPG